MNVLILEIDGERRRLSLSLKRVEEGAVPVPRADGGESVHSTPDLKLSEEAFPTGAAAVEAEPEAETPDAADAEPEAPAETEAAAEVEPEAVASDAAEATKDAEQAEEITADEAADALNIEASAEDAEPEPESDQS